MGVAVGPRAPSDKRFVSAVVEVQILGAASSNTTANSAETRLVVALSTSLSSRPSQNGKTLPPCRVASSAGHGVSSNIKAWLLFGTSRRSPFFVFCRKMVLAVIES